MICARARTHTHTHTHSLQEASSFSHVLHPHCSLSLGLDGVVLVDPELVKGKRGEGCSSALQGAALLALCRKGVCVCVCVCVCKETWGSPCTPVLAARASDLHSLVRCSVHGLFAPGPAVRICQKEVATQGSRLLEPTGSGTADGARGPGLPLHRLRAHAPLHNVLWFHVRADSGGLLSDFI